MVKVIALLLLASVAACRTGKSNFCAIADPLRISADAIGRLSDAEVKALLSHNRKGMRLCGWRP